MINVSIVVSEIDYEKSFANLFPIAIKKCNEIEKPNRVIRFLQKMGNASMAAALGVMNRMTERGKGDLLCSLVNLYRGEIQATLKTFLDQNEFGKNVEFGDIFLEQDAAGRLALYGYDIKVNYSGLADNAMVQDKIKGITGNIVGGLGSKIGWLKEAAADGVGFAAKAAAGLAPGKIEKIGISILEKPENKKKLIAWISQILAERGVCLTLENCVFTQELNSATWSADILEKDRKVFTEELEEELMDAVVKYLKVLLDNTDIVQCSE